MFWTVEFTSKAAKMTAKLPPRIQERLNALRKAIEITGPVQPSIVHFGKLRGWRDATYHCHLNKGRPTYVAVWQVRDRALCLVEVIYAGTHEKAPY